MLTANNKQPPTPLALQTARKGPYVLGTYLDILSNRGGWGRGEWLSSV